MLVMTAKVDKRKIIILFTALLVHSASVLFSVSAQ